MLCCSLAPTTEAADDDRRGSQELLPSVCCCALACAMGAAKGVDLCSWRLLCRVLCCSPAVLRPLRVERATGGVGCFALAHAMCTAMAAIFAAGSGGVECLAVCSHPRQRLSMTAGTAAEGCCTAGTDGSRHGSQTLLHSGGCSASARAMTPLTAGSHAGAARVLSY